MPIYEYRCSACGLDKEYLQKLSDAPITVCERCGQSPMTKLVSAAGFHLKGSGWYATDFKNNGAKPKAKEDAQKESATAEPATAVPAAGAAPAGASTAETKSSTESTAPAAPATQPAS